MFVEYVKRDKLVTSLGYKSYKNYLRSELWKKIRSRILRRSKGRCEICHVNPARQVHHKRYSKKVLTGNDDSGLVAICDECHTLGERGWKQEKERMFVCNNKLSILKSKQKQRHISSRYVCIVCKTAPARREQGKCKACQQIGKPA